MLSLVRILSVTLIYLSLAGCGTTDKAKESRKKTAMAKGTITYNGKPLDFAFIVLSPETPDGVAATCRSDADGNFSLDAYPPDEGAVPGKYRVRVKKMEPVKEQVVDLANHDAPVVAAAGPKSLIPPEYSDFGTSGLVLEVPEAGSESLKLDLK